MPLLQNQFELLEQKKNFDYEQRLMGQQSPDSLIQPYHQTSFYSIGGDRSTHYNQLIQYGLNTALLMHSKRLDKKYQYQQNWNYWKQQGNMMTLPMNYTTETIYPFENETQLIKYPGFDARRALNYGHPLNLAYPGWLNRNIENFDNVRRLPINMQVVFVTPSSLPVQQSCAGPLSMPPFTFNCMSQPLCSLLLPPPLPQIASYYLENNVQQMFMQQYPVTVLSATSNWQISQPIISAYPQLLQQQQQQSIIPGNLSIFPLQIPFSPIDGTQTSLKPQYFNRDHPHTYCTCIPAPISFNNSLISNSQVQHSPTYHHTPTATTNPNIRPTHARSVSLIRPPTTLKNVPNQSEQQYQYPEMNAWSHELPPLPPGAKIMFDEYITKNDLFRRHRTLKQHKKQFPPINKTMKRSTSTIILNEPSQNQPLRNVIKIDNNIIDRKPPMKSKSVTSTRSMHNLSFDKNLKNEKTIINSNNKQLPAEKPNINSNSDDQPRNLSPADVINHSLNSNEKNVNSSSNDDELRDFRLSLALSDDQLSTATTSSTKGEEQPDETTNKSTNISSATPTLLKQSETKSSKNDSSSIVLKRSETKSSSPFETIRMSPSLVKASSCGSLSTIRNKNLDFLSITTISRTDKQSDRNFSIL